MLTSQEGDIPGGHTARQLLMQLSVGNLLFAMTLTLSPQWGLKVSHKALAGALPMQVWELLESFMSVE